MTRDTNLLIIDHNTFRYHTYDLIAHLLMDKELAPKLFSSFKDDFKIFPQLETIWEKVALIKSFMKSYDISDVFSTFEDDKDYPNRYLKSLELMLHDEMESGKVNITETDLYGRLVAPLEKPSISIYVLRHKYETYDMHLPLKTRYFTCSNLFDVRMLSKFIKDKDINAVLLDNAEIAARLSIYTENTTFIFGNYRYNYLPDKDPNLGLFRGIEVLAASERQKHNEFGTFDPFPVPQKFIRKVDDLK